MRLRTYRASGVCRERAGLKPAPTSLRFVGCLAKEGLYSVDSGCARLWNRAQQKKCNRDEHCDKNRQDPKYIDEGEERRLALNQHAEPSHRISLRVRVACAVCHEMGGGLAQRLLILRR